MKKPDAHTQRIITEMIQRIDQEMMGELVGFPKEPGTITVIRPVGRTVPAAFWSQWCEAEDQLERGDGEL